MEMYGYSAGDVFGMDDLLDLSNDDHIFVSSDSTTNNNNNNTFSSSFSTCAAMPTHLHSPSDFTNHICVPTDQVAELEWLSDFVHHSYTDFPLTNYLAAPTTSTNFHSRSRTKRSRPPSVTNTWTASVPQQQQQQHNSYNNNNSAAAGSSSDARRCTHCASEKTPQWRTGPLGPKTLCNACGVRYKSGRLVPEYRPAASPTFVLTQHSNSHRKVMELRRQKEEHDHRNYQLC